MKLAYACKSTLTRVFVCVYTTGRIVEIRRGIASFLFSFSILFLPSLYAIHALLCQSPPHRAR